jgi:hypothetical protein
MSFRLFIYYSALAGAISALVGWSLGRLTIDVYDKSILNTGLKGMYLAVVLALALSLIDALWNGGLARPLSLLARVACAVVVGAFAGMLGGLLSESLSVMTDPPADAAGEGNRWRIFFTVIGYVLVGLLIGASLGLFDLLAALFANRAIRSPTRKVRNGLIGGALGGLVGGVLSVLLRAGWDTLFADRETELLLSPSLAAFAALGLFVGLLIGLTQVILKEAWLRVERGFRAGRELILTSDEITIGRAESCDVGLFGDPNVEKLHARILRVGSDYVVSDAGTPAGTYVNDERIGAPRPLAAGDVIRVGRCVLRFGERSKR